MEKEVQNSQQNQSSNFQRITKWLYQKFGLLNKKPVAYTDQQLSEQNSQREIGNVIERPIVLEQEQPVEQQKNKQIPAKDRIRFVLEQMLDELQKQVCFDYLDKNQISKLKRFVLSTCGKKGLQKISSLLEQLPQIQVNGPVQGSRFIKTMNGIEIFQLQTFSSIRHVSGQTKTALVVGMTGVGKTTFLNSLVNKIMDVKSDDTFRYIIIDDSGKNQMRSITSEVTSYIIPKQGSMEFNIALIDVPGMGDTEGVDKDRENLNKIKQKLTSDVPQLNLVLYVFKSSDTRITNEVRYVINQVTGMFAKNIAASIQFVLTFADIDEPPVVKVLRQTFQDTLDDLNQSGWYLKVNNAAMFRRIDPQDPMQTNYFQIGMDCLQKTLNRLGASSKVSTNQTVKVLEQIEQIEGNIKSLHRQVDTNLAEQENLRQLAKQIANKKADALSKKNYKFTTKVEKPVEYKTKQNVTTCLDCKFTCHEGCAYGNGIDKKNCSAMRGENCINCPKKCSWRLHSNQHFIIKYETHQETVTNENLLKQYNIAVGEKNQKEKLLIKMSIQFCEASNTMVKIIKELKLANESLKKLQLKPVQQTSTIDYLKEMIQSENQQKQPGYVERVKHLTEIKLSEERKIKVLKQSHEKEYSLQQIMHKIRSFIDDQETRDNVIKGVEEHYLKSISSSIQKV